MRFIGIPLISIILFASACGDDPVNDIRDAIVSNQDGRSDWADGDDTNPNYPTTPESEALALESWRSLSQADRDQTCRDFWSKTDDQLTTEWEATLPMSDINAALNLLWRNC